MTNAAGAFKVRNLWDPMRIPCVLSAEQGGCFLEREAQNILGSTKGCLEKVRTGDTLECKAPMVKEFVWQFSLWCPCVGLWVVAVQGIQILDDIVRGETSSSCDIQLVLDDSGPVMHSSVLHVCTFNKLVAFCIISDYSPGVP